MLCNNDRRSVSDVKGVPTKDSTKLARTDLSALVNNTYIAHFKVFSNSFVAQTSLKGTTQEAPPDPLDRTRKRQNRTQVAALVTTIPNDPRGSYRIFINN